MVEGSWSIGKGKDLIDHRLEFVLGYRAIHRLENGAGSDINAMDLDRFVQDGSYLHVSSNAGKDADQADLSTVARGAEGFR